MALVIETDRTWLKGLEAQDAKRLFAYRSDPAVFKFHAWNPESLADAERFIEVHSVNSTAQIGEWKQLGIYKKPEAELIGDCGFYRPGLNEAEIGYTIVPSHQGQGLASEVVVALVKYLQGNISARRIIARTDPENIASIKVLKRAGFEQVSHVVRSVKIRGEWKDDLVFCRRSE